MSNAINNPQENRKTEKSQHYARCLCVSLTIEIIPAKCARRNGFAYFLLILPDGCKMLDIAHIVGYNEPVITQGIPVYMYSFNVAKVAGFLASPMAQVHISTDASGTGDS
jgi:hypothetical protein